MTDQQEENAEDRPWRDPNGIVTIFQDGAREFFASLHRRARVSWRWKWTLVGVTQMPECPDCGAVAGKSYANRGQIGHEYWHADLTEILEEFAERLTQLERLAGLMEREGTGYGDGN